MVLFLQSVSGGISADEKSAALFTLCRSGGDSWQNGRKESSEEDGPGKFDR